MKRFAHQIPSVTNLEPVDTPDSPYYYTFKVQCTSCREVHPNWVGISRHRESTASIVDAPGKYVQESPPKPQRLVRIDCRGLEFVEFKPDGGEWTATGSESSTKFSGIDLDQGDWYDYDEKSGEE
ncbi:MAG: hypothetical protein LQ340_002365, partial [Diploschistes diacapsis]